ncbi:MAG: hypothetical protein FJX77_06455 [Armatimonadetes bacterium]|nr:hypothetical protein [Armatimonadota bacterium]
MNGTGSDCPRSLPSERRRGLWALGTLLVAGASLLAIQPSARATNGVVISNGTVALGVHSEAQLIVPGTTPSSGGQMNVGIRLVNGQFESLSPGCDCEGWGIADLARNIFGDANQDRGGPHNLAVESFNVTPNSADSVVKAADAFRVRHNYVPSALTPFLYVCNVTITNSEMIRSGKIRYRRLMDWDVEPTEFEERVTIQRGNSANLVTSTDDGFAEANPLRPLGEIVAGTRNVDFVDSGPEDHGAAFDFEFAELEPGQSHSFKIFYGAAPTEVDALNALAAEGAEVFSLGQSSAPEDKKEEPGTKGPAPIRGDHIFGTPATSIFGFAGVGGAPVLGDVTNIEVVDITQRSARILWSSPTPTTGVVRFGNQATSLTRKVADNRLKLTHEVVVSGLTGRAPTFFEIEAITPPATPGRRGVGISSKSPVHFLIPGRTRVSGLTPGIAPRLSGSSVCFDTSIFNTCREAAMDVKITAVSVDRGGNVFDSNLVLPNDVGVIKGMRAVNGRICFPVEAFGADPTAPIRFTIQGTKVIGRPSRAICGQWKDVIIIPPLMKSPNTSRP